MRACVFACVRMYAYMYAKEFESGLMYLTISECIYRIDADRVDYLCIYLLLLNIYSPPCIRVIHLLKGARCRSCRRVDRADVDRVDLDTNIVF